MIPSFTPDDPSDCETGSPQDTRIYIVYHDLRPVLKGRNLVPIQAGRAISDVIIQGVFGDDTGKNISALNSEYSELTAHYWAWKNDPDKAAIGLMHYRRLLDLTGQMNPHGHPERYMPYFDEKSYVESISRYFLSAEITKDRLIVPRLFHLRASVLEQYRNCHDITDLHAMRDVVAERHPDFLPDLEMVLGGKRLLLGNMFIMAQPVFEHYSSLLFDILAATREGISAKSDLKDRYQSRYLGFLAERILTAYVLGSYARKTFPNLELAHKGIVNIDQNILREAGWLRLMRFYIQGRVSAKDVIKLKLGHDHKT